MALTKATQNVIAPITSSGSTTARTLTDRFADAVNVKDFGAVGDGVTNDTAAINLAIASLTDYKTLFFPSGKYKVTAGGISNFQNLQFISVIGEGRSSVIYDSSTGSSAGNYFVFLPSCNNVTIKDLDIVGSATARGNGIGIRMYASDSTISNIYITGTSDFGILVSNESSGYANRVIISNCVSYETRGDGFHIGHATDCGIYNCSAFYTWDDGLGIGDDEAAGRPPNRIEVANFMSVQAGNPAGGGSNGSGIRIFDGATNVNIIGGQIKESGEPGLQTARFSSTTAYCSNIQITGLKVYSCLQTPLTVYGNIQLNFANDVSLVGCWSESPATNSCYGFLDCNNLTVKSCTAKDPVLRGFVTDENTTTNVANTWSNWEFSSNTVIGTPTDAPYYIVPPTGKSISNLIMVNNTEIGSTFANFITTAGLSTEAIIANNTSISGKAIVNNGGGIVPRTFNNNFGVRGVNNTANGVNALVNNTSGDSNTGIGAGTLETNTVGYGNTALGRNSLNLNTDGYWNSAIGLNALRNNGSAHSNTACGTGSLESNVSGNFNTGIGRNALYNNTTFSNVGGFGYDAQVSGSNQIRIGDTNITSVTCQTNAWSDERDKDDTRDTILGLDFIKELRPVDFRWDFREDYRPKAPTIVMKPVEPKEDASDEDKAKYAQELAAFEAYVVLKDKWIEDCKWSNLVHDGTHKRTRFHHGLIAQEVKSVIEKTGIDFGGFQDHTIKGGDAVMTIGYTELIAPLIKAVQELSAKVEALESK